ncbi:CBS domain-containing protein [Candidatus Uabimicrobium amorphum]|uniref:Inosine-5-monophosphate dehydrogenase n=1 Tax=Uabimicrobium amorphum TaxID=2596890 RepID=A0A5S9IKA3_UABAM|nr:CBS domain-containing protein [Candidatus Uabimicrobium amorphum]BBM82931.1 inosine-5-monophosphate dehydrogenase [Candidatus Uabimicrobium amorphum]
MAYIPKTKEFMEKKLFTLDPDMDVYNAIDVLITRGINSAAVVDKRGNLVGILSEKDCLLTLIGEVYDNLPGRTVSAYMTRDVKTISPETDIFVAADTFLKNSFRRLLVVDHDRLVGQITRKDLLRAIMKLKGRKVYNPISGDYEQESNIGLL